MNPEIVNAAERLLCAGETTWTRECSPPQDADLPRREVRLHQLGGSTQTAKAMVLGKGFWKPGGVDMLGGEALARPWLGLEEGCGWGRCGV